MIFWVMFCLETMGPVVHMVVNLTCTIYLNISADQIDPFITVLPNGSGLFHQVRGTYTMHSIRQVVLI